MKKSIRNIIIIILLVLVAFGVYYFIDKVANKYRGGTATENAAQNMDGSEAVENQIVNKNSDSEELPENNQASNEQKGELKKIELSDEEIVNILIDVEPFEDGTELSTEQYLSIAYNALNDGYIEIDEERGVNSGEGEVTYTVNEINSIIYSLFGVTLKEYKDFGDVLKYKDGKYTFQYSDRGTVVPVAKNIEHDTAAGTVYIQYDLYRSDDGEEEYIGQYAIGKSNVSHLVRLKREM